MTQKTLDTEQRTQLDAFWAIYRPAIEALEAALLAGLAHEPGLKEVLSRRDTAEQREEQQRSRRITEAAFERGEWEEYGDHMRETGRNYARMKVPFHIWLNAEALFRDELLRRIEAIHGDDGHAIVRAMRGLEIFISRGMSVLAEAYVDEHERVVREHQEVIRELSTPILRIKDNLLVAPIVGLIDTYRARQLTQSLLHAIRTHRARVVVLDVTGVPIVDSKVANHLLQTVEASRLMGAHIIVSGIAPEIAQTLVAIGADLGHVETVGEFDVALQVAEARIKASAPFVPPQAVPPSPAGA